MRWQYVVWFCNHAMLIVGLSLLFKNRFWLTAMLNWAIIPVTLWAVDFLSKVLFGVFPFKVTDYLFEGPFWLHVISLQHLITVPLMLYAMWLLGRPHKWAWTGTALHGMLLLFISYFFIRPDFNVLCAHSSCVPSIVPDGPYYLLRWTLTSAGIFIITNFMLVSLFRKRGRTARRQARARKRK